MTAKEHSPGLPRTVHRRPETTPPADPADRGRELPRLHRRLPSPAISREAQGAGDCSTTIHDPHITTSGTPEAAREYRLGSRMLEWIIDRHQVKTDEPSGIVNDPSDSSREIGIPRHILDLIAKVARVNADTVAVVDALLPLRLKEVQA